MKKVKINLLAIIGMMVAVGTLAFTTPKEMEAFEDPLWFYTEMTPTEENNPDKYELATGGEVCEGETSVRCLISAPLISDQNGDRPDLSNATEISHKL